MRPAIIYRAVLGFVSSLLLVVFPYPIGTPLRLLGYREGDGEKTAMLQFCSLGNFVCLAHLITAGWIVGLAAAINAGLRHLGWGSLPLQPAIWCWLLVLIVTLAVLAFQVDRYVLFLLISWGVISLLVLAVLELASHLPVSAALALAISSIPVAVEWGIPIFLSASLGLLYAGAATWSRLNNVWSIPRRFGNEIHHHNFERRDRSIYRLGKTFVAEYPCLLRKYLFFGYGNIEVRSAGGTQKDHIEGVIFAEHYARQLVRDLIIDTNPRRTSETISVIIDAEAEEETEAV